jgi:hypothetical protein
MVWIQQFLIEDDQVRLRQPAETPPTRSHFNTPYDTEDVALAQREGWPVRLRITYNYILN